MNLKNQFVALLIFSIANLGSFASQENKEQNIEVLELENTSRVELQLDVPAVAFSVNYPGLNISGICEIQITADSYRRHNEVKNILNAVEIIDGFRNKIVHREIKIHSATTLSIPLKIHSYLDMFILKTKKPEQSLKEAIREQLGESRTVIIAPIPCTL